MASHVKSSLAQLPMNKKPFIPPEKISEETRKLFVSSYLELEQACLDLKHNLLIYLSKKNKPLE